MTHASRGGRRLGAALCIGSLALAGCTTEDGSTEAGGAAEGNGGGPHTDTIRGAWITDPVGFLPMTTTATDDYRAARLLYDTVLRRDIDGELIGGIADDYELEESGLTLTIGEGHTCADGTEITPTVVADSLTYFADETESAVQRDGVFGPGEATITADDDASTVVIELSEPHSDLPAGLAIPQSGIVCPAGLEDPESTAAGQVEGAFSGPYVLSEANDGVSYVFELREAYDSWPDYSEELEGVPAQYLEFYVGIDDTVANQLLTDELDVAPVTDQELDRFEDEEGYDLTTVTTGEFYILFNHGENSPFQDEEMRRALAQIVDRETLAEIVDPNGELIATLGDENMQCANTDFSLLEDYNADAASEALDGVQVNVIGTNAIGQNGAGAIYVQEQLLAAGAEVELQNLDVGTWVTDIYEEPEWWDVTVFATVNNIGTISWGLGTVIGVPHTEGGRNTSVSNNPAATEALDAALAAGSEEEMCEYYQIAQEEALAAVDFIPISMDTRTFVVREGFTISGPGGNEDLTSLRILD